MTSPTVCPRSDMVTTATASLHAPTASVLAMAIMSPGSASAGVGGRAATLPAASGER